MGVLPLDNKLWDDVSVGEDRPAQAFPLSWRTLMAALVAGRDFLPYHYHPTYAKALGMRGAIFNTLFYQGLTGRFVTDWLGPDSDFRSASWQMHNQTVPGDVLRLSGRVEKKWQDSGDSLVELALELRHDLGVAVTSTVLMAMPSIKYGQARLRELPPLPKVEPNPQMPEEARSVIGKRITRQAPYPVCEAQIMHLAEMTRDRNPLYLDSEYARSSRHGEMIAPFTSLLVWTQDANGQIGIDSDFPDPDLPDQPAWPIAVEKDRIGNFRLPGTPEILVQKTSLEFSGVLKRGDRVTDSTEMINCSALKRTRRGPGYFVTYLSVFSNQRGEVVGRNTMSLLMYRPTDDASDSESGAGG